MKIFLIGLPGVGKTTFGKSLAKHLNIESIDLDLDIEKKTGSRITDIFKQKGEAYFREIEKSRLKDICKIKESFVLSVGGGTPSIDGAMELMKSNGVCIYLTDTISNITQRIAQSDSIRPLFQNLQPTEIESKLLELQNIRQRYYEQTHIITGVEVSSDLHLLTNRVELFTKQGKSLIDIAEIN